ncbi:MAG TPA: cytochrome P450 [Chthoniobacter sp.]|nr:cytochrome P450 [Chthoniobacter sp.]
MSHPSPPGPHDTPPAALLYAMRRDPIAFFTKLAAEHGDFVRFQIGAENSYHFVNHPDVIKEVLVNQDHQFTKWFAVDRIKEVLGEGLFVSEGEFHSRQRRLSQPAFHRHRIAQYADTMVQLTVELRQSWCDGAVVDICQEMNSLAMQIVAKTLFGADMAHEAVEIRDALSEILDQFERSVLPEADRPDFEAARARLDAAIYRIIKERRASGEDRGDLLSMLLAAHDAEGDGRGMTDVQLRDEAMTIFLAGHETTANAMAWCWYLLSTNPACAARFYAEVDEVLGSRRGTLEDVPKLAYATMVFAEALRMYPPVWVVGRRAKVDCEIGGYLIPAKSVVLLSPYVTQRDPRYFPEPSQFDPERWTPEAKAARPKFSYFPFSSGSRSCLGEPFAWMEGVLCLATLAQTFRLQLVPGHRIALQPQLTLRAKYGIRMQLERRSDTLS